MDYDEIRQKYARILEHEIGKPRMETKQYEEFRQQYLPKKLNLYEKACNISEKILAVSPDKKQIPELEKAITKVHLNITPKGVASFALLAPLGIILAAIFLFFIIPSLLGSDPYFFFIVFFTIIAFIMIVPLGKLPLTLATNWRIKASNQMVLSIFYLVTYMRHTSNLELAIDFAAEHLAPPLSLDMKKIIWDVETEKYESVKESLDNYLESWKETNMEFIESMHLIEGSLLESSEARRLSLLDKSLTVMLDETYEKMMHYAHNLKGPITTLHMLGIILPILGLVILPLVVTMIEGVYWYHLFTLYNIALPIGVYILGRQMLAKRPTGYGNTDVSEMNPELKKYKGALMKIGDEVMSVGPAMIGTFVLVACLLIGFSPLAYGLFNPGQDIAFTDDASDRIQTIDIEDEQDMQSAKFFFYGWWEQKERNSAGDLVWNGEYFGPFGIGAALLSLFIPLGIGLGIGLYYRLKSKHVLKIREATKRLEQEFASGLFQLGNRLADGLPAEIAFSKVANVMSGTETGRFFELTSMNIANGMSVEQAIFDNKHGALLRYPSNIIESSMKVLVESSKKGPIIASQAVINVSEYIKQMHRVDERLRDLMADVISSMKSQISFLTPVISGIVIGITSMITKILGTLTSTINNFSGLDGGGVPASGILEIFGAGGIPTFYFQSIVGLYVVQLAYVLTILVNGIENGIDPLSEQEMLGTGLIRSTMLYVIISFVIMLIFNIIAGNILANSLG